LQGHFLMLFKSGFCHLLNLFMIYFFMCIHELLLWIFYFIKLEFFCFFFHHLDFVTSWSKDKSFMLFFFVFKDVMGKRVTNFLMVHIAFTFEIFMINLFVNIKCT
jgi:hypothetical protein